MGDTIFKGIEIARDKISLQNSPTTDLQKAAITGVIKEVKKTLALHAIGKPNELILNLTFEEKESVEYSIKEILGVRNDRIDSLTDNGGAKQNFESLLNETRKEVNNILSIL